MVRTAVTAPQENDLGQRDPNRNWKMSRAAHTGTDDSLTGVHLGSAPRFVERGTFRQIVNGSVEVNGNRAHHATGARARL